VANAAAAREGDRTPAADAAHASDFAELRSLIVGPEQRQLRTIQARLDDPASQARDVSRVLPVAMLLRKDDPQMTRALAPTVEEALTASVRRNPRPLADALFPIFGPAIRKAIAASLSSMLESLNQTLEHSLSWRALQWRATAWRTGKPFAEVVLLNTLIYRVEQVFLIERDSGLLLQHVTSNTVTAQDADMVSGMLTAIRDFARDSFRVSEDDTLDQLRVGDLSVWIEQGPHAILAVVIRGTAPPDLRLRMQETVEHVHARMADTLAAFDGNTQPFEAIRPALEGLIESSYRTSQRKTSPVLWGIAAALVLLLGWWSYTTLEARFRWKSYVSALRAEPGIVVVSSERRDGKFVVSGLRDPLARDPDTLLAASGMAPDDVVGHWELYQALDPPIVQERARQLLRAPDTVQLKFNDGVLTAGGAAPVAWIRESARLAAFVPGVVRYDDRALVEGEAARIAQALASVNVLFARGSTTLPPDSEQVLAAHLERIRELDALGQASGRTFTLEIEGHADGDGPPERNDSLSFIRASVVRAAIDNLRLPNIRTEARGAGSREPLSQDPSDAAKRANRRVELRLVSSR
jgi:outer membrane protein OmpA-like peptidoglycan-associated protein